MKALYTVVLSLGTNQGNRKNNIVACLHEIAKQIGGVVKTSGIYETPAWGFESDPFYNSAVLLQTSFSPHDLLIQIQQIENKLGRIRSVTSNGYQARVIDIDIILYEDFIINEDLLQVPHPHFHNRKFVLKPLLEFDLTWKHPLLNQTIFQLYESCKDDSVCVLVEG